MQELTSVELGSLLRVNVRDIWRDEQSAFTPWLSAHLDLLGDAVGLSLALEGREVSVGMFRADILAKDALGRWAIIENQLERTDHTHLGQILTYASGLDAATIIWISDKFTDEHRAVFDWLNKITPSTIRFFGIEIEVWRIGDSLASPRFSVVSAPNTWKRSVTRTADNVSESSSREREGESKANQGREFTINHFRENGELPTLTMVMAAAGCSKGFASRLRSQVASELHLVGTSQ